MSETFDEEEDLEEQEEGQPRRRIRHYKKEAVMLAECHTYVNDRKRLPILHSRWILNRYVNDHNALISGIPIHNRVVDELWKCKNVLANARLKLAQIEEAVASLKQTYPVLIDDEHFQELERLADKNSAPR